MASIVYGTHVFTKWKGYYGERKECPNCKRVYKQSYVRYSTWAHLEYIPLFPIKIVYNVMCPICGYGYEMKWSEAKEVMQEEPDETQKIDAYGIHNLAKQPTTYDFYVKDVNTNEEICVQSDMPKAVFKRIKKARGLKNVPVTEVKGK